MGQEESSNNQKTNANIPSLDFQNKNLQNIPAQYITPYHDQIFYLDLTGNCINELPKDLPNLRTLILASNKLTSINENLINTITSYEKLEIIDLSLNYLTQIPNQILKIRTLTRINIFGNRISSIDLSKSKIITIDCGQNWFENTPQVSPNIQYLCLDMNFLNFIDQSTIPNLTRLSYRINQITSISSKAFFPQLQVLDLSYNKLKEIPDLSKMTPNLKIFDASYNEIVKFPKFPRSIIEINLQTNQIETIPDELINYSTLGTLNLSENRLERIPKIPRILFALLLNKNRIKSFDGSIGMNLRHFSIYKNKLEEIPFFEKSKIRDLYLFSNCITKVNTSCIHEKVTKLDLTNNFIEELPDELFDSYKLPNLLHLIVARNKIKKLPQSFKNSTIISFNISCNPISELPNEFPKTIEHISAAHCGLSFLPESLGNCEELVELDSSGNDLTSIPYMKDLTLLHLSMNKIVFFPEISTKLVSLDLSMNFISIIPNNLKFNNLQYVDFSYNKLIDFPCSFIAPKLYSLKISHNPIISTVFLDSSQFPYLNMADFSESKIKFKNENDIFSDISKTFIVEHSDGSLQPSEKVRFIHCDTWCSVARKRGLRESIEDSFIIRTELQKNLNIFGLWDARLGGKTAAIGTLELTNLINNKPFEFKESYFEPYCSKMTKILNERTFIDGSAMGLCACNKTNLLYANCGDILIMIIGEKNDEQTIENDKNHNDDSFSSTVTVDVIENTSIIHNEILCEIVESSSSRNASASLGLNIATHFVCGIKEIKPTDKWIIIASPGVTDFITPNEIALLSKTAQSSAELSYKLVTISRASSSTESASVVVYCIKEANSA